MQKNSKVFKNLKILCCCAMFMALSAVIAYVCKLFLTLSMSFRITFENLPIILSGIFFGPVAGLVTGLGSDLISTAVSQYGIGGINPIITLGAGSVGLVAGLCTRLIPKKKSGTLKLLITVFAAHIVGNMLIKSLGLHLFYSFSLPQLLPRIPLYIIIGALEFTVIMLIIKNKGISGAVDKLK